jgi:hypothetical protein
VKVKIAMWKRFRIPKVFAEMLEIKKGDVLKLEIIENGKGFKCIRLNEPDEKCFKVRVFGTPTLYINIPTKLAEYFNLTEGEYDFDFIKDEKGNLVGFKFVKLEGEQTT